MRYDHGKDGIGAVTRSLTLTLILPLVAAAAAGRSAVAQQRTSGQTGAIAGAVQDESGNALVAAEVTLLGGDGQRAVTDEEGQFLLVRIPLGDVRLGVRRLGYQPREVTAYVAGTRAGRGLTVVLKQLPQRIAAIEVEGKPLDYGGPMAGFYQRLESKAGGGRFFTRAQIDSIRPYSTTDLLRRVPGLGFTWTGSDMRGSVIKSRDRRCSPLVWVDGTPTSTSYYNPDLINPRTIEGMEVYSGLSTVPPQFAGPAGAGSCGVIAIWTRVGERQYSRPGRSEREEAAAVLASLIDSVQVYTEAEVDQVAQFAPSARFSPEYPAELRQSKVTGVVVTEFVVDASGHIEPETVGVVYSPHPLLTEAVSAALSRTTFTPAQRAGHAVRQLVQLPVHFVDPQGKGK